MKFKYFIIVFICTIFTGSVFLTSNKFVNSTNTPKFYFTVLSLLILIIIVTLFYEKVRPKILTAKMMLWGINIVCFLQALYGISQYVGWLPSHLTQFPITGSFKNPAGFAAVVSLGFPIGLFLHQNANKNEKYFTSIVLATTVVTVYFSESRSGILAIVFSFLVFLTFSNNKISKYRQVKRRNLLIVLITICLTLGLFFLYKQKKASADGRLLIWGGGYEMIKDAPVFGHGFGAFRAKYMDYQANYFKNNPESKYSQLADNTKYPFNEFIKIAVEFGLFGLIISLSFLLFILRRIVNSKNANKRLVLSGITAIIVFSCFSYPLIYAPVWLLLTFYISISIDVIKLRKPSIPILVKSLIIVFCVVFFIKTYVQMQAEIRWAVVSTSSLRGNAKKRLNEYHELYQTSLRRNPYFLYNYAAELNVIGQYNKSIDILTECKLRFNDYDLQMLLADNYLQLKNYRKTEVVLKHASDMIPNRFYPLYQLVKLYQITGQHDESIKLAKEILEKPVKIPSSTIDVMKLEMKELIKECQKERL